MGPFSIIETWTYDEFDEYFYYDVTNTHTGEVAGTFEDKDLAVAHAEQLVEMVEKELLGK